MFPMHAGRRVVCSGRRCPASSRPGRGRPSGRRAYVDAVEQHGGCSEVAEVMQPDLCDAEPISQASERERRVVRPPRRLPVRGVTEDVAIGFDLGLGGGELGELLEGDRIECETTFGMGLGRSLHGAGDGVRDLAGDVQRLPPEVDVSPLQGAGRVGDLRDEARKCAFCGVAVSAHRPGDVRMSASGGVSTGVHSQFPRPRASLAKRPTNSVSPATAPTSPSAQPNNDSRAGMVWALWADIWAVARCLTARRQRDAHLPGLSWRPR